MSGRRLVSATLNYGMAAYLPRILNFVLLPLYTAKLSPTQMGVLEVMGGVDALVTAISRMGLPGALSRSFFDDRSEKALREQLVMTAVTVTSMGLFVSILAIAFGPYIFERWLPDVPFHPYVEITLLATWFRIGQEIQARLLQAREAAQLAARINISLAFLGTAARVILVVVLDGGIGGACLAEVVTAVAGTGIALFRHRDDLGARFRPSLVRPALAYGLPLVPHQLSAWVGDNSTRWILAGIGALDTVGMIAVGSRLASPIQVGVNAFTTAYLPMYFGWRTTLSPEAALAEARKATAGVAALAATIALSVTIGGIVVLRWFLPHTFSGAADLLGVMTATLVVRVVYSVLTAEVFHMKRTGALTMVFFFGAVVTIASTLPLMHWLGPVGAVLAQFFGICMSVAIIIRLATQTFPSTLGPRSFAVTGLTVVLLFPAAKLMPGTSPLADIVAGALIGVPGVVMIAAVTGVRPRHLRELRRGWGKTRRPAGQQN